MKWYLIIKQSFLTEVPLSSFKKAKLFCWINFFGEDKEFPF